MKIKITEQNIARAKETMLNMDFFDNFTEQDYEDFFDGIDESIQTTLRALKGFEQSATGIHTIHSSLYDNCGVMAISYKGLIGILPVMFPSDDKNQYCPLTNIKKAIPNNKKLRTEYYMNIMLMEAILLTSMEPTEKEQPFFCARALDNGVHRFASK